MCRVQNFIFSLVPSLFIVVKAHCVEKKIQQTPYKHITLLTFYSVLVVAVVVFYFGVVSLNTSLDAIAHICVIIKHRFITKWREKFMNIHITSILLNGSLQWAAVLSHIGWCVDVCSFLRRLRCDDHVSFISSNKIDKLRCALFYCMCALWGLCNDSCSYFAIVFLVEAQTQFCCR